MGSINSPGKIDSNLTQVVPSETSSKLTNTNRVRNKNNRYKPYAYDITKRVLDDSERDMFDFLRLIETPHITKFLSCDPCLLISDKYLLAMTFEYFKRCGLKGKTNYTQEKFFVALYIANEVEEDEENYKYEIFPWVMGKDWSEQFELFFQWRDSMLIDLKFDIIVEKSYCDKIMNIVPNHWIWDRQRKIHHSGTKNVDEFDDEEIPRGPYSTPKVACDLCLNNMEDLETNDVAWSPKFQINQI